MLEMLRDLIAHKAHANTAMLAALRQNAAAAGDPDIADLLHHILIANRFWLLSLVGLPFVLDDESLPSASLDALIQRYATTQAQESAWISSANEADLTRVLESPLIPGGKCSVAQALVQVCMHSHGHRAQCAKLLRRHGDVPPTTDFIDWLAAHRARDLSPAQIVDSDRIV
jgi:uncharacterized damage-inducible protein DinB